MPIYEYKCQQCGAHFEKRQNISDAPLTTCEKCHGPLEKQWSLSGFQFKGAGWYVTDYAGGKGKTSEKSSSAESTTSDDSASKSVNETKAPAADSVSKSDS